MTQKQNRSLQSQNQTQQRGPSGMVQSRDRMQDLVGNQAILDVMREELSAEDCSRYEIWVPEVQRCLASGSAPPSPVANALMAIIGANCWDWSRVDTWEPRHRRPWFKIFCGGPPDRSAAHWGHDGFPRQSNGTDRARKNFRRTTIIRPVEGLISNRHPAEHPMGQFPNVRPAASSTAIDPSRIPATIESTSSNTW